MLLSTLSNTSSNSFYFTKYWYIRKISLYKYSSSVLYFKASNSLLNWDMQIIMYLDRYLYVSSPVGMHRHQSIQSFNEVNIASLCYLIKAHIRYFNFLIYFMSHQQMLCAFSWIHTTVVNLVSFKCLSVFVDKVDIERQFICLSGLWPLMFSLNSHSESECFVISSKTTSDCYYCD
jgi:hypothetical protein